MGGGAGSSLLSATALLVCMQAGRVARCGNIFSFVLQPLGSHGLSGGGGTGIATSLLSAVALLAYMPADRKGECAGNCFCYTFFDHFLRTRCWGEERVPSAFNLRAGVFSMHAKGSGATACRTFCFAPLAV